MIWDFTTSVLLQPGIQLLTTDQMNKNGVTLEKHNGNIRRSLRFFFFFWLILNTFNFEFFFSENSQVSGSLFTFHNNFQNEVLGDWDEERNQNVLTKLT